LTVDKTNYIYVTYTIDEDDGTVSSMQMYSAVTIPVPTEPESGKAPTEVNRLVAAVILPATLDKGVVTINAPYTLTYRTVVIGWDVNTSGEVINLLSGILF